ncbi:MAG: SPOR domain-containing protein [Pseudomonadales bacterium]|nr:SPOR domain-containing protein [Pseudomonadales bacterium]
MENGLKQRLVGALVLLMLAIIFLPLILDGRDEDHNEVVYRAPQEPVIQITHKGSSQVEERIEKAKAQIVVDRTPKPDDESGTAKIAQKVVKKTVQHIKQKTVSAAQQSNIDQTRVQFVKELAEAKKVKETPVQSKMALADAWTVQVAAFSKLENAKALQLKLISKSYMAYIVSNGGKDKALHRVFVGPELRKNRARIIQQALKKEFKLAGMIKSYNP